MPGIVKMKFLDIVDSNMVFSLPVFLWEFDDKYDMIKFKYKIRVNRDGG